MSLESKEERMIQTMRRFLAQRDADSAYRINDRLPPKQERLMQSMLKQAIVISKLREEEA